MIKYGIKCSSQKISLSLDSVFNINQLIIYAKYMEFHIFVHSFILLTLIKQQLWARTVLSAAHTLDKM